MKTETKRLKVSNDVKPLLVTPCVSNSILYDEILEKYMSKREMYVTKEVVNSDFKTIFKSNRTYYIDGINIEWVNSDTVICYIFSNDIECSFSRTCSKEDFFNEIKGLFIPISGMYDLWKHP